MVPHIKLIQRWFLRSEWQHFALSGNFSATACGTYAQESFRSLGRDRTSKMLYGDALHWLIVSHPEVSIRKASNTSSSSSSREWHTPSWLAMDQRILTRNKAPNLARLWKPLILKVVFQSRSWHTAAGNLVTNPAHNLCSWT